jgi:hypothetical protein
VLFIQCRGSIVVLDVDNRERMVLLDEVVSEGTANEYY